jgi:hypothetical protein
MHENSHHNKLGPIVLGILSDPKQVTQITSERNIAHQPNNFILIRQHITDTPNLITNHSQQFQRNCEWRIILFE